MQVHHLIEECIVFNMSKEECMEALSKHANIKPVITSTGQSSSYDAKIARQIKTSIDHTHSDPHARMYIYTYIHVRVEIWKKYYICLAWVVVGPVTVWKELEKENKEFFEAYAKSREERAASEEETSRRIQSLLSDSSKRDTRD